MEESFRFQKLEIWKRGAALSHELFEIADRLEQRHLWRFAEQLRAATLSITNNIAEGSGSVSDKDFAHFLNISRRSIFEVANMLLLLSHDGYLGRNDVELTVNELEEQSRMTLAFMRRLSSPSARPAARL